MGVLGMLQWKFPPCMILLCLLTCWNTILKHEVDASYDIHKVVFVSTLILVSRATERADYGAWSKDKNDVCVFDFKHCIETAPHNVHNQGPWLLRSICWTRSCYWSVPQCGSDIRMGLALPKKCKVKKLRHETKLFPPPGALGHSLTLYQGLPTPRLTCLEQLSTWTSTPESLTSPLRVDLWAPTPFTQFLSILIIPFVFLVDATVDQGITIVISMTNRNLCSSRSDDTWAKFYDVLQGWLWTKFYDANLALWFYSHPAANRFPECAFMN